MREKEIEEREERETEIEEIEERETEIETGRRTRRVRGTDPSQPGGTTTSTADLLFLYSDLQTVFLVISMVNFTFYSGFAGYGRG